jgi:hypothetical protein
MLCKVFGLRLEFRYTLVSKTFLFETIGSSPKSFLQQGYRFVSKLISISKYQYLANDISFDTIRICQHPNRRRNC